MFRIELNAGEAHVDDSHMLSSAVGYWAQGGVHLLRECNRALGRDTLPPPADNPLFLHTPFRSALIHPPPPPPLGIYSFAVGPLGTAATSDCDPLIHTATRRSSVLLVLFLLQLFPFLQQSLALHARQSTNGHF